MTARHSSTSMVGAKYDTIQIACPRCGLAYNHLEPGSSKGGRIPSFGRADEKEGLAAIVQCEQAHVYIIGVGEHKGVINVYVRTPQPGEIGRDLDTGELRFIDIKGDRGMNFDYEIDYNHEGLDVLGGAK